MSVGLQKVWYLPLSNIASPSSKCVLIITLKMTSWNRTPNVQETALLHQLGVVHAILPEFPLPLILILQHSISEISLVTVINSFRIFWKFKIRREGGQRRNLSWENSGLCFPWKTNVHLVVVVILPRQCEEHPYDSLGKKPPWCLASVRDASVISWESFPFASFIWCMSIYSINAFY